METRMDVSGLFGGVASLLSGGLTGIIGAGISKYADYKTQELANAQALAMRDKDAEIAKIEADAKIQTVTLEGEQAASAQASDLVKASYDNDKASYSSGLHASLNPTGGWESKVLAISDLMLVLVDFCRGMVRPSSTVYFLVLTSYIYYKVSVQIETMKVSFTVDQSFSLYYYVVLWILYTAAMVLGWWFGVRPMGEAPTLKVK